MGHEYELESEPLSSLIGGISPPAAPGSATRRPPDWGSRDWESWPRGELAPRRAGGGGVASAPAARWSAGRSDGVRGAGRWR